ncbi:MAG: FG-GAP repeat protein, partial [Anaerolineales bacterium]|nr:FG-GAP repeat protein [Anaerolineales bacterium]
MQRRKLTFSLVLAGLLLGLTALAAGAAGLFAEPDVSVLYTLEGDGGAGSFGWVAASLGDLNGDGAPETIVTAPFIAGPAGNASGKVYVYDGATGALLHDETGARLSLFGHSATVAGDVNGDGTPDYVVGAPTLDVFGFGLGLTGQTFVYSGADHSLLLTLSGPGGAAFGASVSGAGDVDGDGHADIFVGSTYASVAQNNGGQVALYSGADGSLLWTVDGAFPDGFLGSAVGALGDVSGDGVPDLVAGAQGAGRKAHGEAYALSGVDGNVLFTMKPVGLPSEPSTFAQYHASAAPDVNGDGITDIYVGDYNARRGQHQG